MKPWQLQQAVSAVRIYRDQSRGARKREDAETLEPSWHDEAAMPFPSAIFNGIDWAARNY